MKHLLQLEVITPESKVVDEFVSSVTLPESDGYVTLLPGHTAVVAELGSGELEYIADGNKRWLAVTGGFLQLQDNRVKVLANSALSPKEIDLERARKAEQRAQERMSSSDHTTDYRRAASALHRAQARVSVATAHME
jgi:F-type H+-transporting ATPase subunit epsilon